MFRRILLAFFGLILGGVLGFLLLSHTSFAKSPLLRFSPLGSTLQNNSPEVIGFLPYWLLTKAQANYTGQITDLAYFDLTIDTDGHILKLQNNGQEAEPGWNTLNSGKADQKLTAAKNKGQKLSLVAFAGDNDMIGELISDPVAHADNLMSDVIPLMKQYGFSDLNLDVEPTIVASDAARMQFSQFVGELKHELNSQKLGSLTVEVSPTDLIQTRVVNASDMGRIADRVVVMAYDYHFTGSIVTGAVAPLFGAGTLSEYDAQAAVTQALKSVPKDKLVLGIPDYGYGWEAIGTDPRSAVIPGTGLIASSQSMADMLSGCSSCSAKMDPVSKEPYVVYKDADTGTYHQYFYPDQRATQAKVDFVENMQLKGLAVWALGYEDGEVLKPLGGYLQ